MITAPILRFQNCVVYIAHKHDDWPMFRIWFAVAAVTASIVLNLGVFTLLVSTHIALDMVKYRSKHTLSWYWTVVESLRESLIDIFFVALGLVLALALHHSAFARGGLGRRVRLEEMVIILILRIGPRLKIAEHLLEIVMYWRHHYEEGFVPHAPLRRTEKGLLIATIILTASLFLTPLTTHLTWKDVGHTVAYELTPRLELGLTHTIDEVLPSEVH